MPNLDELSISLKSAALGRQLWEMLFTEPERQRLGGDLEATWEQFGTVGMWLRVRGGSRSRAIVELAHQLDLITDAGYQFLLRTLGDAETPQAVGKPSWNRARGELRFGASLCRTVVSPARATSIVAILDAFEEERWPDQIDDPLPGGSDPQRLREAIRTLNEGLTLIRFRGDGSGQRVVWEAANTRAAPARRP